MTKQQAGRKPGTAVATTADDGINTQAVAGAMETMRDQAQEDLVELLDLASAAGAVQAMALVNAFTSAAQVQLFRRVRDSRQIKHLPLRGTDGKLTKFTSMREACPVIFGRTYEAMLEAETRLETFGEEAYEAAQRLGLNRSALRAARALPPEKLEAVRSAIADGSSKAAVLSVIEDLAITVVKAEAERDEAKAEKEAGDHLLEKKNKRIDALERKLRHFDKAPPDEQLAELQKAATSVATEATGLIAGTLRQAVIALQHFGEERGEQSPFLAGLLGQVQAALSGLRQEFNLPDISQAESELQAGAREAIRAARQARSER